MTKRALTLDEIHLAQQVFGTAIDYAKVKIGCGAWWLVSGQAAMCTGTCIVFPPDHYVADFAAGSQAQQAWLIHELTHVWQYQQGFALLWGGICLGLRGGYLGRRGYHCPNFAQVFDFRGLNMEQQAEMMAQFFQAAWCADARYVPMLPHYRRLLKPFFQRGQARCLLPHY